MGSPQGALGFMGEAGFTLASGAGQARLPWRSVQAVWCCPGVWLLLLSRPQFITLPHDDQPEAKRSELLERVRQTGGKVT